MRIDNKQGIALILSLLIMTCLIAFSGVFLLRVCTERSLIQRENNLTNAYYLAEAGAQAGVSRLNNLINSYLLNMINNADGMTVETKINAYVNLNNGLELLTDFVKHMGVAQLKIDNGYAVHTSMAVLLNDGQYQYSIRIRPKGTPALTSPGTWDFAYYFTIDSLGTAGGVSRRILGSGDFTVRVQKGDFAKQVIFNSNDFNVQGISLFTASSGDITDKITWQEGGVI